MRYDPEQKRVVCQPVTIEPRETTPTPWLRRRASIAQRNRRGAAPWLKYAITRLNFGPQPSRRTRCAAPGARTGWRGDPARRSTHRLAAPRDRKTRRKQDLSSVAALYGPAGLCLDDVQRTCLRDGDREARGIEVPERAQYIRVMFDEITRVLNHCCGSVRTVSISGR